MNVWKPLLWIWDMYPTPWRVVCVLSATHTLALVVTDITNPFFTVIARGVEDTASKAGFAVIYGNTDESEPEEYKYAQIMAQKQVDGVLLVPACSNAKSVEFLQSNDIPVVLIDRIVPNVEADVVRCNSEGGAYQLTKLLLDLGHEKITMITGPRGISTSDDRVAGYRRALAEAGLAEYDRVYYGAYTQASGYRLAEQVLNHTPPPTALFGANNFLSISAMKAIRDMGLRVPDDIAVVSFDDLPTTMVVEPFLTVAAQPAYEMGLMATDLLLARLSGDADGACQEIILPTEIIVRPSSGGVLS